MASHIHEDRDQHEFVYPSTEKTFKGVSSSINDKMFDIYFFTRIGSKFAFYFFANRFEIDILFENILNFEW